MFQFAIRREFITVAGVIGIVTALWAAWLIETPGLMPL
jgi:hypothetical protein